MANFGTQLIYVCSHGCRVEPGGDPHEYVHVPARPGQPARDNCNDSPSTFQTVRVSLTA